MIVVCRRANRLDPAVFAGNDKEYFMTKIPTARGDEIDSSDLGFTLVTECVIGPRTAEVEAN